MESKILIFNTGKAELCFVKVPTNSNEAEIVTNQAVIPYGKSLVVPDGYYKCFPNHMFIDLPSGNWQIVGNPFELTTQQCKDVMPKYEIIEEGEKIMGYKVGKHQFLHPVSAFDCMLRDLEIYQTNPSGKKPLAIDYVNMPSYLGNDCWADDLDRWQEAEERTGSFILLKKIV